MTANIKPAILEALLENERGLDSEGLTKAIGLPIHHYFYWKQLLQLERDETIEKEGTMKWKLTKEAREFYSNMG